MGSFVKVAETTDFDDVVSKRIDVNGKKVALFKVEGGYFAISDTCTHEEASISEGDVDGNIVACPRHGARFDVKTGAVLSLPAMRPLETYEVKVDGDDILLKK